MSTFDGVVHEFPSIRIDNFRFGEAPFVAGFLSHVHSDHLHGLDSPNNNHRFVYCSHATKEILLRLEKYSARIAFATKMLEKRCRTYSHLKKVLKPLPLETPVKIRLEQNYEIQVTLFDANHCPGSTSFLIEGQGKAIFYTGDTRSEPWFVKALRRNPSLVEYTTGIKTLDTIYLDTTFLRDVPFQTKAEGIRELLVKVSTYPPDTVFHFRSWTYGYEHVWIALAKALGSQIHVDKYHKGIYDSLVVRFKQADQKHLLLPLALEASALTGFMCGNEEKPGCLTDDDEVHVRVHSCEKGSRCARMASSDVVWISPIVCHAPDGKDWQEVGAGGGDEILEKIDELGLVSITDTTELKALLMELQELSSEKETDIAVTILLKAVRKDIDFDFTLDPLDDRHSQLSKIAQAITNYLAHRAPQEMPEPSGQVTNVGLPSRIYFPYSRHSSYPELVDLVAAFRPKDVWPCTADPARWNREGMSISALFGPQCSGTQFRFDGEELAMSKTQATSQQERETQETASPVSFDDPRPAKVGAAALSLSPSPTPDTLAVRGHPRRSLKRDYAEFNSANTSSVLTEKCHRERRTGAEPGESSQGSDTSEFAGELRESAYRWILQNVQGNTSEMIGLISTTDHHSVPEEELG